MRLLDELGLDEKEYTHPEAKITHLIMSMMGKFQAILPMALMQIDRNYIYGVDRNKFDTVLWKHAASLPNVTACQNFAMIDVVKDANGRIAGIIGRPTDSKTKETITSDLVVGADGRFSLAARKFGAQPFEELNDYPSASYHAEWEGVAPHSEECPQPGMIYQLGNGYSLLCFPVGKQKYIIGNYLRTSDTNFGGQKLEDHYIQTVQSVPDLRRRLKNSRERPIHVKGEEVLRGVDDDGRVRPTPELEAPALVAPVPSTAGPRPIGKAPIDPRRAITGLQLPPAFSQYLRIDRRAKIGCDDVFFADADPCREGPARRSVRKLFHGHAVAGNEV
jgi:hypothetical protein